MVLNKTNIFLLILLINKLFIIYCDEKFNFNKKYYQDIVINNNIVSKGIGQKCSERYLAVKNILKNYKRDFTLLDIGSAEGYFSFKTAYEFPNSTCVMIEQNDHLEKLCKLNTKLNNIVLFKKKITIDELKILSESEHFDAVLALNVIHHFGDNWRKAADYIIKMADNIIIETPPKEDNISLNYKNFAKIEKYIASKSKKIICKTPRWGSAKWIANTYWIENLKEKRLERKSCVNARVNYYKINSNYIEKFLINNKWHSPRISNWQKGINLLTFKLLNGIFPLKETLKKEINLLAQDKEYLSSNTKDFMPHNMIVQGNKTILIDIKDTLGFRPGTGWFQEDTLNHILNLVDEDFKTHDYLKEYLRIYIYSIKPRLMDNMDNIDFE